MGIFSRLSLVGGRISELRQQQRDEVEAETQAAYKLARKRRTFHSAENIKHLKNFMVSDNINSSEFLENGVAKIGKVFVDAGIIKNAQKILALIMLLI